MMPVVLLVVQVLVLAVQAVACLSVPAETASSSSDGREALRWVISAWTPSAERMLIHPKTLPNSSQVDCMYESAVIDGIDISLRNFMLVSLDLKEFPENISISDEWYLLDFLHEHLNFVLQYVTEVKLDFVIII